MDRTRTPRRLAVPCSLDQAALVRSRLRDDLRRLGVPGDIAVDAEIVLGEMLGNALLHGRPRTDGSIGVDWAVEDRAVRLAVSDGGSPPRLRAYEAPEFASTGRGLRIVSELASEWGVEMHDPRGVTVWAVLAS